jgi:hypothetical protein
MKMRKFRFLAVALLGASSLFLTSCEDDDTTSLGPTLIMEELGSGKSSGEISVTPGTTLTFTWDSRKGDRDLNTFAITMSGTNTVSPVPVSNRGNEFPYTITNANDETYVDTLTVNAGSNLGKTSYTFTVTDKDGNTKSVSFEVTVEAGSTPLSAAKTFEWKRVGGAAGTGLAQFGLEWTQNSGSSAIVKQDASTKMVQLTSGEWSSITTDVELAAAVDGGTDIADYRGVSATANGTYDDVLGVAYNGDYFLIHVTKGTVTTGGSGTTITIDGEYKN